MSMELDDMKQAWLAIDHRLAQQEMLSWQIFRDRQSGKLQRKMRPLVWGQYAHIVLGMAIALWGVRFWSTHTHIWQAMVCGIAMQAFGTLAIIFPARALALVHSIDYAAPVLAIQHRIAHLRAWRVQVEAPVFAILGSVIWIPAMLMLFQYGADRAGIDLWQRMSDAPMWLGLSGAVSLGVVALAYALVRKLGHRRWLENQLAGGTVTRAESMLETIAQFERE